MRATLPALMALLLLGVPAAAAAPGAPAPLQDPVVDLVGPLNAACFPPPVPGPGWFCYAVLPGPGGVGGAICITRRDANSIYAACGAGTPVGSLYPGAAQGVLLYEAPGLTLVGSCTFVGAAGSQSVCVGTRRSPGSTCIVAGSWSYGADDLARACAPA